MKKKLVKIKTCTEREGEFKRERERFRQNKVPVYGPCNYHKMRRNLGLVLKEGTEYRKKKTLLFKSPLLDESQSTPPEFEIQPSTGQGK